MRVAVVGQGYVGLTLSAALVRAGHHVFGVESDTGRLNSLKKAQSYIPDVKRETLAYMLDSGRYTPAASLDRLPPAQVYVIAVPTPSARNGEPDLRHVDVATDAVARVAGESALVIVESTMYPGSLRNHVAPRLEAGSGLRVGGRLHLVHSPERIDPGRTDIPLEAVPKLVGGIDLASTVAGAKFYESVFEHVVPVSSSDVAEFAKLLENTYRYVNIAYVNELGQAAHAMGIDFREVIDAAASKPYGFMPFHHGPGVGGHCLPNNVTYLRHALRKAGFVSTVLDAAENVNTAMPGYVVRRLESSLRRRGSSLRGASVLLLGLAYKAGVPDWRNSPSHAVGRALIDHGAKVFAADPLIRKDAFPADLDRVELSGDECARHDAVLLLTDHPGVNYEQVIGAAPFVLDCRGHLGAPTVERL